MLIEIGLVLQRFLLLLLHFLVSCCSTLLLSLLWLFLSGIITWGHINTRHVTGRLYAPARISSEPGLDSLTALYLGDELG